MGVVKNINNKVTRLEVAKEVANQLLDDLETGNLPIGSNIMKAKRLARLLRDTDAQIWLDFEMRGYPSSFNQSNLGDCEKYAIEGGRVVDGRYWLASLPKLEAYIKAHEISMQGLKFPSNIVPSVSSSNPHELVGININKAVTSVANSFINHTNKVTNDFVKNVEIYNGLKSSIHNYVTDMQIALSLGDVTENIFEEARNKVDLFIGSYCPKAAEQLVAINERLIEGSEEALAEALTSCRRILCTVADAVFPPSEQPYKDSKGKERKVGKDYYKNRLIAYLEQMSKSSTSTEIASSQIEHTAARLDAVYEKVCKGVHADVDKDEATLAIINTYLIIAEIAK
jgi:hypothetical protein